MTTVKLTVMIVLTFIGSMSSSAGIPDIFLIELRNLGDSILKVRIGYFGKKVFTGNQFVSNLDLISPQDHVPWHQGSLHAFQRKADLAAR